MAKRLTSIFKINTAAVQGEDSWAKIRKLNVAEQRRFRKEIDDGIAPFEVGCMVLKENVVEWNWVDDDGEPLPQPKDDPDVIETLTDAEVEILGVAIRGNSEEAKN